MPRVKISPDGTMTAVLTDKDIINPWLVNGSHYALAVYVEDWTELVPEFDVRPADVKAAAARVSDKSLTDRQVIVHAFATNVPAVRELLGRLADAGRDGILGDYSITGYAAELMMILTGDIK